jgi:ligand-binding sensor domain-containing protein
LKNGSIANIAIDQLGNKWIVDNYGLLSKFDGSTWTDYFQIDSFIIARSIASIAVDKSNNLWLRTYSDGVLMFDGTHITKIQDNSNPIFGLVVDPAGKIWWYNNNKFYNYDGTTTNYYTTQGMSGSAFLYAVDNQNNIWAYFYNDDGFYKFDGTTWTNYSSLSNGFVLDDFTTIAIDHQNIVWAGTTNKGLFSFDGSTWTNYNTLNSNLLGNAIRTIAIDASNRKWIATDSGLCKFDGVNWETYTTTNTNHGLVSNDISCIAFDPQGNRWIGTSDYGISVLSGFPLAIQEIPSSINANDCYPNPAQNKLYFHHITAAESLSVFDLSGKLLLQKQLSPTCNNIDVSSLAKGMYLYKHGNTTGKFVKE